MPNMEISETGNGLTLLKKLVESAEEHGATSLKLYVDILDMTISVQGVILGVDNDDGSAMAVFQAHTPGSRFAKTAVRILDSFRGAMKRDQEESPE